MNRECEAFDWYEGLRIDAQCLIRNQFNRERMYKNKHSLWEDFLIMKKIEVENREDYGC